MECGMPPRARLELEALGVVHRQAPGPKDVGACTDRKGLEAKASTAGTRYPYGVPDDL
jgi:hypothetical protein